MSKFSGNKGAAGERELFSILSDKLGIPIKRGLSASREGGADSLDLPGFAVEVKRVEKENVSSWWKQTCNQAGERLPVLFYRASRKPWTVIVPLMFFLNQMDFPAGIAPYAPVTLDVMTFCAMVKAYHLPTRVSDPVELGDYARRLTEAGIK